MTSLEHVSSEALSETIGSIYDCALDPHQWPSAIQRILDLCESRAGALCVHDLKDVRNDNLFSRGHSKEFLELFDKHYPQSPMATATILGKVGDVLTVAMLSEQENLFESRFYREIIQPHGYLDFIGVFALRTGHRLAALHACRMAEAPLFSEREISLFRLLSPHICRTLAISDALDIRTLKSEMLEATLDGLTAGVYLTARDGRVVYMNAAAERQIRKGSALQIVNKRLTPTNQEARMRLVNKISNAASGNVDALGDPSLALPEPEGAGYVATFLPLDQGDRQACMQPFAAATAIFVQDPAVVPQFPGEAFARLYGLTGGELRVALTLAPGLTPQEAADMLGIGLQTVKTHLQRIFQKTGTTRQADLIALMTRAAAPAAAV